MSIFTEEEALELLKAAKVFYNNDDEPPTLNMNDTFMWALAYGADVPDDKLVEVAELFWRYGNKGLEYWCVAIGDMIKSEFEDVQRGIDFVRHEEELRVSGKSSDERAYHKLVYTLGERMSA